MRSQLHSKIERMNFELKTTIPFFSQLEKITKHTKHRKTKTGHSYWQSMRLTGASYFLSKYFFPSHCQKVTGRKVAKNPFEKVAISQ